MRSACLASSLALFSSTAPASALLLKLGWLNPKGTRSSLLLLELDPETRREEGGARDSVRSMAQRMRPVDSGTTRAPTRDDDAEEAAVAALAAAFVAVPLFAAACCCCCCCCALILLIAADLSTLLMTRGGGRELRRHDRTATARGVSERNTSERTVRGRGQRDANATCGSCVDADAAAATHRMEPLRCSHAHITHIINVSDVAKAIARTDSETHCCNRLIEMLSNLRSSRSVDLCNCDAQHQTIYLEIARSQRAPNDATP